MDAAWHPDRKHTAPRCNTLRQLKSIVSHCNTLQHTATYCNTLQHTVKRCNTLQYAPGGRQSDGCSVASRPQSPRALGYLSESCLARMCVIRITHTVHTHTHTHTLTHTHTHTHTHTKTHTHTQSHTHTHTHTLSIHISITGKRKKTAPRLSYYTHTHTIHTHTRKHTQTHTYTHTHTHRLSIHISQTGQRKHAANHLRYCEHGISGRRKCGGGWGGSHGRAATAAARPYVCQGRQKIARKFPSVAVCCSVV